MLRQHFASARTSAASRIALAVVVGSLVAVPAGTGTAMARTHAGGGPGIARAHDRHSTAHGDRGFTETDRADGANTSAVAVNTTDHSLVFQLSFAILRVTGNVVDNQNVADAYASCNGCQTVAISIQTLLVQGVANVVAPINEASARNQNCEQCDTVAIAYQFVIAPGTTLKFTPEGRREIAYIRRQLESLRRDARRPGMTGPQIVVAVAALMKQYAAVLSTELVPAAQPGDGGGSDTSGTAPAGGATSSTTAASSAPSPGASTITSMVPSTTTSTATAGMPGAAAGPTGTPPTGAPTDAGPSGTTTDTTLPTTGTSATTTDTSPTTTDTSPTTTDTSPTTTDTTSTSGAPTTTNTFGTTTTAPGDTAATTTTSNSTTSTTP